MMSEIDTEGQLIILFAFSLTTSIFNLKLIFDFDVMRHIS